MAVASPERLRDDLVRLVHRGGGVRDFSMDAARILARAVPFDGVCLVTMDPATLLPTGEVVENGLPQATTTRMAEIEIGGEDLNSFNALRRSGALVASLSETTGGDLDQSLRHRELRRPNGFGDELRVALVGDSATWGGLTLLRGSDQDVFTPADTALVASLSGYLAEGLRRAMLCAALSVERQEQGGSAGLVLLAPDNSITRADATAELLLAQLVEDRRHDPLPAVVTAVASRARSIGNRQPAATATIARARVRTASGRWLLVRGSTLGDGDDAQTAVILEPAQPQELAPLIAIAYGLTDRERAVTQLVAQGYLTSAIADRLHISQWTVQDHLKSIFEKVGVGSRGELVARVFFEHYAPRLTDGATVGADGFFSPSSTAGQSSGGDDPSG
jgi:DNA-binding CsgD family transcriptional regulator